MSAEPVAGDRWPVDAITVGPAPYQLFEPLREEEYAALKADIERRGVQVAIEFDEQGAVLDGHHRLRICHELGVEDYPRVVRSGLSEEAKREHVLKANLLRRHLGPLAWAQAFRQLAEQRGVRLEERARNDRTGATAATLAAEVGVAPRTARYRLRVAADLANDPQLAAKVDSGEMEARRALRLVREQAAKERARTPISLLPAACDLRLGDFRVVLADIPDGSLDIVMTDPPYPAEYLPLWDDLGAFAKRVLKPDGLLVAMSGQTHLPTVFGLLGKHMEYRWVISYQTPGAATVVHARNVQTMWKPVLVYGSTTRRLHDVARSDKADKEHHGWGQSEVGMADLLRLVADPGQVICDPFVGGGTTAVVALAYGCSFIGAEVDRDAYETSLVRVSGRVPESRGADVANRLIRTGPKRLPAVEVA